MKPRKQNFINPELSALVESDEENDNEKTQKFEAFKSNFKMRLKGQ